MITKLFFLSLLKFNANSLNENIRYLLSSEITNNSEIYTLNKNNTSFDNSVINFFLTFVLFGIILIALIKKL